MFSQSWNWVGQLNSSSEASFAVLPAIVKTKANGTRKMIAVKTMPKMPTSHRVGVRMAFTVRSPSSSANATAGR